MEANDNVLTSTTCNIDGKKEYANGNYDVAFAKFVESLNICPNDKETHKLITDTIYRARNNNQHLQEEDVVTACKKIIEYDRYNKPTYLILNCYMKHSYSLGGFYKPLLIKEPYNDALLEGFADFYTRAVYDPEVIATNKGLPFNKGNALSLIPKTTCGYLILGKALTYAFKYLEIPYLATEASDCFEKGMKLKVKDDELLLYYGILMCFMKVFPMSAESLGGYYDITGDDRVIVPLGVINFNMGKVDEGLKYLSKLKIDVNETFDNCDRLLKYFLLATNETAYEIVHKQGNWLCNNVNNIRNTIILYDQKTMKIVRDNLKNKML